jgi:hypothetical protein
MKRSSDTASTAQSCEVVRITLNKIEGASLSLTAFLIGVGLV